MLQLKVALISEEYPPFTFGGVGAVCQDLAQVLSKNGVQTTVLCGRAKHITIEQPNPNLKIIRLPCLDSPPRFLWFQLQNLELFKKLFREFSVLHIMNAEAGGTTAYLGKKLGVPVVTSIHGTYMYPLKKVVSAPFSAWSFHDIGFRTLGFPLHTSMYDICLQASTKIAVCNYATVAELEKSHPNLDLKKVQVIPNAIDFQSLGQVDKSRCVKMHSIISTGRLFWVKGFGLLVEAVNLLKREFPDISLQIFGNGAYRPKLDELIIKFGLQQQVKVTSHIPRQELWDKIAEASIGVQPSLHEAQSVSMLEAMALNKPMIAFNYPFAQEVIREGYNGLLAEPKNVRDLADKIRQLFSDEKKRQQMGQNAYQYVSERHNWRVLIDKYLRMYEQAISTPSA